MIRNKHIEFDGLAGFKVLEYDHEDTGCPVYRSPESDLWVKVFPDGTKREIHPLGHHRRDH